MLRSPSMSDDAEPVDDDAPVTAREQRDDDDEPEAGGVGRILGRPFEPGNPYRFQPGQSGNPNGRPKGIGDLIDRVLEEVVEEDVNKRKVKEILVRAVAKTAMRGGSAGVAAFRELMDRRFGRVPLSVRLGASGDDDESFTDIRVRLVTAGEVQQAKRVSAKPVSNDGNGNGNG